MATELGARCCGDSTVNQSTAQASPRRLLPVTTTCHSRPLRTYYLTTSMRYATSPIYSLPPVTSLSTANLHSLAWPSITSATVADRRPLPIAHLLPWLPDPLTTSHCHHLCACQMLSSSCAEEANEQNPPSPPLPRPPFTIHKPSSPSPLLPEHN